MLSARPSNGFHGGCRRTLPAGGQKGVSPRRNAYTALLRSCIRSCMILVSRWFLQAYTSSPTWSMSSTKRLAFAGPRDDAARTAANSRFMSPGTTLVIRDSVRPQPCSFHAKNSTALSVRGRSAVNSSTRLHRSRATSSSHAQSKRMWPMSTVVAGVKKITFSKGVPKPPRMIKQVFLGRFELVVARFGPWKIPKCLENGPF